MKAYKGFNKDMTCRGFQYKEGETYETDKASICREGFHACLDPLNTFSYYQPANSIYHEVEVDDGAEREENGDSKVASRTIKIGARLSIKDLVKAQIGLVIVRSKGDAYSSGEESSAATSGNGSSAATSGYRSNAATSGNGSSAATSGDWSSAATSGNGSSAATSGDWSSAATSGDWSSAATSGYRSSAATSGNGSSAATSGEESSAATDHANGIALANGKNSRARGTAGSWLVLTEWSDDQTQLLTVKAVQVDGEKVKPGIFYKLSGGDVVEAEELE